MKNLGRKELDEIGKLAAASAREEAFAAGLSISYEQNGKIYREYPDGRITEVIYDESGNRKEIDVTDR